MFTVSDLANEAQVTTDTVRHYVKLGLLQPKRDSVNGYKIFSNTDTIRVQFIRNAKSLGFTLKEISEIFSYSEDGNSPCPEVRELLKQHIEENRARIEELNALQGRMERALRQWNSMPDGSPNGTSVCHLIESIADDKTNE